MFIFCVILGLVASLNVTQASQTFSTVYKLIGLFQTWCLFTMIIIACNIE